MIQATNLKNNLMVQPKKASLVKKEISQEIKYLGKHLVFDFWGCANLNSTEIAEKALREAVEICGATLLEIKTHAFTPQGVSGFALISESHISMHSWPEYGYLAVDVFTCGERVLPQSTLAVFKKFFRPKHVEIFDIKRGSML
jgi:S-adenosylmethionine decarboxylase